MKAQLETNSNCLRDVIIICIFKLKLKFLQFIGTNAKFIECKDKNIHFFLLFQSTGGP